MQAFYLCIFNLKLEDGISRESTMKQQFSIVKVNKNKKFVYTTHDDSQNSKSEIQGRGGKKK